MNKKTYLLTLCILMAGLMQIKAQENAYILDRVVAVVGDFHVLQSDIEQQKLQIKASQPYVPEGIECEILNYFIEQKLLMTQAKIDSIEVTPGEVEQSMEGRLNMFISQIGSIEEMEEYFNKSIYEIRTDLRETMQEMMLTQQVQQSIIGEISITPSEVKDFFKSIPKDSIPFIDSEVKVAQIVAYPPINEDAEFQAKEQLLELRKRIMDGESMSTLAILYSDDPSATENFGEIGFRNKNELDPAYTEAAWSLKEGQVSKIVKSEFGYHIIQCIARKGDRVNSRHILIKPKIEASSKAKAISRLDSIKTQIDIDSVTFSTAAKYFSEDEDTRANGGILVNPMNQAAAFQLDELDTKDYYIIRDMKVGEVSAPYESTDANRQPCYKIIKLISRTEPHRANLKQDYLLLQNYALNKKQSDVMQDWYKEKKEKTYIKIDPSFENCQGETK